MIRCDKSTRHDALMVCLSCPLPHAACTKGISFHSFQPPSSLLSTIMFLRYRRPENRAPTSDHRHVPRRRRHVPRLGQARRRDPRLVHLPKQTAARGEGAHAQDTPFQSHVCPVIESVEQPRAPPLELSTNRLLQGKTVQASLSPSQERHGRGVGVHRRRISTSRGRWQANRGLSLWQATAVGSRQARAGPRPKWLGVSNHEAEFQP